MLSKTVNAVALLVIAIVSIFYNTNLQACQPTKSGSVGFIGQTVEDGGGSRITDSTASGGDGNSSSAAVTPRFEIKQETIQNSLTDKYEPSSMETYMIEHAKELKLQATNRKGLNDNDNPGGCGPWKDPKLTSIYDDLQTYRKELQQYTKLMEKFPGTVRDLRLHMANENDTAICDSLELHPDGMTGIFSKLSKVPGGAGYVEPLLPPLRHPEFCFQGGKRLMDLGYLVHDFAALCRNKLKKHSRTVFVDMGAALDFHGTATPAVYVTQTYQRFGFHFDHIYAYEISKKEPTEVYKQVPDDLKAAYHWYNVGVDSNITSSNNPLKLLLENFNTNDFIVVKLDIDTSWIEVPMVQLLLEDKRISSLIDCFYFEHHVMLKDLARWWKGSMKGTVEESLGIFTKLRQLGVASHYWP